MGRFSFHSSGTAILRLILCHTDPHCMGYFGGHMFNANMGVGVVRIVSSANPVCFSGYFGQTLKHRSETHFRDFHCHSSWSRPALSGGMDWRRMERKLFRAPKIYMYIFQSLTRKFLSSVQRERERDRFLPNSGSEIWNGQSSPAAPLAWVTKLRFLESRDANHGSLAASDSKC